MVFSLTHLSLAWLPSPDCYPFLIWRVFNTNRSGHNQTKKNASFMYRLSPNLAALRSLLDRKDRRKICEESSKESKKTEQKTKEKQADGVLSS